MGSVAFEQGNVLCSAELPIAVEVMQAFVKLEPRSFMLRPRLDSVEASEPHALCSPDVRAGRLS